MNHFIEELQTIPPEKLVELYKYVFGTQQGKLVLEDLKGRFWEYDSPRDIRECGQYSVLVHIKNQINPPIGRTEELPNEHQTDQ